MGVIRNRRASLLAHRARRLRREQTQAETRLWAALRDRQLGGWKWRRQVPLGPYILDFLCVDASLVVELDGEHHAEHVEYDERRTMHLWDRGLRVMRFRNDEVLANEDAVCRAILDACDAG